MKSTALVATIAVLAAAFSVAANAQTGRPSADEVHAQPATRRPIAGDAEPGSYARYLMLNGRTRDEAVAAARHIDTPAARRVVARERTDATASLRP